MWSLGRRLWRDVLSGYGWGFFAVSVIDVVIGPGSKCLYPPSHLGGPLPPFLMIKRGECGGWLRCCLLPVPEEHFMLKGLTAAHRCLRWSRRAAWSTPAWPLTVCCLQEGHPDPTAVHKAVFSSVCVPLPGEWSLKTLMSVPEISCQWGEAVTETRFKQRLILMDTTVYSGKILLTVRWLSFLTWCCFCLGFFPQLLVTLLCSGVGILPRVFLAWGDDDKVLEGLANTITRHWPQFGRGSKCKTKNQTRRLALLSWTPGWLSSERNVVTFHEYPLSIKH